jgi:alpha-glucosidase
MTALSAPVPAQEKGPAPAAATVTSPDGRIVVAVGIDQEKTRPVYRVSFRGEPLLRDSALGLVLDGGPSLAQGLTIAGTAARSHDSTWTQPWGEEKDIREHYNELTVRLAGVPDSGRALTVVFRVFDDGIGFRYEIPAQPGLEQIRIKEEVTEFSFTRNLKSWWIPAYQDNRFEYQFAASSLDAVDVVHTPMTLEGDGIAVALHEAALVDFASMVLRRSEIHGTTLKAELVPWADGIAVYGTAPMKSSWRTIQIADAPHLLLNSRLILNLNEPNALGDVSWVKPTKYMGIWWCMHIRTCTWEPGPNQGATTENAKRYIDAAAELGIPALLIEGWNIGWDTDWFNDGSNFDFTKSVPGFDLETVVRYGKAKGVSIIGHHETAADIVNYERQLADAFALYGRLGVPSVKTGYVGTRLNKTEWHHGQLMVRHFEKVMAEAAKHRVTINAHEPIKDTGLRRTWPHMLSREGARGQEYDAWGATDNGNLPDHTTIIPFTRMLSGPMDYTPGIFDLRYGEGERNGMSTTLAKQLALYVVIYSPVQMVADLPENYRDQPAFQFIRDVPVDWAESIALSGVIGDHVTIARKDRAGDDWYLGSVTDEQGRDLTVSLDFLDKGRSYRAEIYADGEGAHWLRNPQPIAISTRIVTAADTITLRLAPGGGQAIRFTPAK